MRTILKIASYLLVLLMVANPFSSFAQNREGGKKRTVIHRVKKDGAFDNFRAYDKEGVNVFEPVKEATLPFDGVKVKFGAGFTQSFQALKHENAGGTTPALYRLSPGFAIAQANLYTDVQLAEGIKLNLTTYLSARHHNEAWVKGGYIQIDKLPFKGEIWDKIMEKVTIKAGHMEINYGDQHFRRSDGGHTGYNPFAENYIMDAFATEVAGEVYVQDNGFTGMLGFSNGLINGGHQEPLLPGSTTETYKRAPSVYAKLAYDHKADDFRVRGAASVYHNNSSGRSTLYAGDRTGSNYFFVMEGTAATSKDNFTSGRYSPNLTNQITALQLNGFLKFKGLEVFGTLEKAKGRTINEKVVDSDKRKVTQFAAEGLYRIGEKEKVYIGARFNTVNGQLIASSTDEQKIQRFAVGGGWFITNNILMKAEYVTQQYNDFPAANILSQGKFNGIVIQAAVGF